MPTPGNAGAAEGAFYLVFSAMGSDGVFWAMLVWRIFCHYSFILIGAGIYGVNALRGKRRRRAEIPEPEESETVSPRSEPSRSWEESES